MFQIMRAPPRDVSERCTVHYLRFRCAMRTDALLASIVLGKPYRSLESRIRTCFNCH